MAYDDMDLLDIIKDAIDALNIGVETRIGVLGEKESISVLMLPSNNAKHYMDGSIDQRFNIQVDGKFKKQRDSYNTLGVVQKQLLKGTNLRSKNGSYVYDDVGLTNTVHLTSYDDEGFYIYTVTIFVDVQL